nr:hypothetical protein [Tanacetum cinerariifolium]
MVAEDDETPKDKEIDKLMALISLSRANQDNSLRINRSTGYENQRIGNVARAREIVGSTVKPKRVKDAAYHREKMLLCKQEEARIQLNAEQADWREDTDDELEDQELEVHYMYIAKLQEVSPDATDSGPIFDTEPLQKVSTDDHYNVFAIKSEHPEQSKSIHDTYPIEQDEHNVIIDSLDMSYDIEQIDQNDDDADLVNECKLLASLIEKIKCEIDESKNRNKFLETSNKILIEKLIGEIEDFKNKNKSLESSNNRFKEANNKLSETNNLLYNDFKKSQADLARRNDVEYASKDKGIVISELKKLIEKLKGKSMNTKFEKSLVIRQLNTFKSQRPSILGKPTTFSNSHERNDFLKSKSVTQNNVSNDFSKPVTTQILPLNKKSILKNTNVLAPRMYKLYTEPTQTRTSQLPQDFSKTNKRLSFSTGVIPTTSVSKPQLKSNRIEDRVLRNNSQGKKHDVEGNRRNVKVSKNKTSVTACNDSMKAKTLNVYFVCATCGKCVLNEKHDMCVLKSINDVNSRTKMPIVVPVSTREPKCTVKQYVEKPIRKTIDSESNQKPKNITRKLYERVRKACSWWYPKFTPSGYKWKPKYGKENVNPNVSMPLGIVSRTFNILEPMTSRHSNVSKTPLSSNSFVARRDCPIHCRLWVLKV